MGPRAVVVGPPGAGKTTVGQALAEHWGVEFRDTDADVEQVAGKAISEIFTHDGEDAFRELEERAVETALAEHSGVLALGGGAIVSERTRKLLATRPVLYLAVGLAEGAHRTGLSQARPLLTGVNPRATFKALLDARTPLYREVATVELNTDGVEPAELVRQAAEQLG
jgi:shikimate kinase